MLTDIITVARKELKEILVQRGSPRSGLYNLIIVLAIMGIMFPLQNGPGWLNSPISMLSIVWLPLLMSMGLIADSFAGERERHTLETLLATRLTDRAILFGKMGASVSYAMGLMLLGALLGAVTLNVTYPGAGFYDLPIFGGMLLFSLLGSILISGIGVLVSLRAENVRQAYQQMSIGYLVIVMPLVFLPTLLPPATQAQISSFLSRLNGTQVAAGAVAVLLLLDLLVIALGLARFQRSRLIAD